MFRVGDFMLYPQGVMRRGSSKNMEFSVKIKSTLRRILFSKV